MKDGWIKLYRKLLKKPIWKLSTPEQRSILITVLLMANHDPAEWEWKGIKFDVLPGQFVTSLESIRKMAGMGISIQNVRSSLKRFEKLEFLTNKATKSGRLISIINWELYQPIKEVAQQRGQQRGNKGATPNKNDKNERSLKETQTPPFLKAQSKHFEHQVGEYFKGIKINCEIILKLPAKNGRPFNPFEWIQEKVNKARHPGAINESLSGLIQNWEGIENPYGYANSILKTTNPNWIEKDNIIKSKEKWLIIKDKMAETFKEFEILNRV